MRLSTVGAALACLMSVACVAQQSDKNFGEYSSKMTWTAFTEYSNTSNHILMGYARQRQLVSLGGGFTLRLARFGGGALSYVAEFRPAILESDVTQTDTNTDTIIIPGFPPFTDTESSTAAIYGVCQAGTFTGMDVFGGTTTDQRTCGHRWTYAQGLAPVGFKYSFGIKRRVQPFLAGSGGYMYSDHPIPLDNAGSFNFTFDFGGGIEIFRTPKHSITLDCRFHHFSNHDTAPSNPGTDNVMYKVAYSFGR